MKNKTKVIDQSQSLHQLLDAEFERSTIFPFAIKATMVVFGFVTVMVMFHNRAHIPDFESVLQVMAVIGTALILSVNIMVYHILKVRNRRVADAVSQPLLEIIKAANRAAENDSSSSILPCGIQEFDDVARSFNKMMYSIRKEISERRRAETELANSNFAMVENLNREKKLAEAAREASRIKSEFLANMSHEIRTPMNGLIAMSDILAETSMNKEQKDYLSVIRRSADTLLEIINDILDFSKIEAGKVNIEYQAGDMRQAVDDVVNLFKAKADEKGILLKWQVSDKIPDRVLMDETRVRQILSNLISNAIKFTSQGSIAVTVNSKYEDDVIPTMQICVKDTGIGMSSEVQKRVFESFTQANGTITKKYGGTGLGLTISKNLVELMNGTMGVDSIEGIGSQFWFEIPLLKSTDKVKATELIPMDESQTVEPKRTLHAARVLLADDNEMNLKIAMAILEQMGCKTTVVETGVEALKAYQSGEYDIVLMDVQMPEMDGLTATKKMREMELLDGKHTPVVAITAHAFDEYKQQCLEAGMDDFISKPFKKKTFEDLIERWVAEPDLKKIQ
jgi:signal transduction histidine kinase/ActR/RegA family two-component response regulator